MGIRQLLEDRRLRQQAAEDGEPGGAGGQGGEPGAGESGAGDEGADKGGAGGMMRAHSQAGQGGDDAGGGGQGGEDPFAASASDDGRPLVDDGQGNKVPLPDQFWDAEQGQVRTEALAKSWRDTRSSFDRLQSENAELKKQVEQGNPAETQAPEKPEEYKFEKPEEFTREIAEDDTIVEGFKQIAHRHGLSQEQFQSMASDYLKMVEEQLGPPIDPQAERQRLGPNADAILESNAAFFDGLYQDGTLSQEEHDEIMAIGETAAGVRALNKLRERMGEQPIPMEGVQVSELPSKQEWYQQMNAALDKGDQAEVKRLEKLGEKIWGTQPAGSSEAGYGVPG